MLTLLTAVAWYLESGRVFLIFARLSVMYKDCVEVLL